MTSPVWQDVATAVHPYFNAAEFAAPTWYAGPQKLTTPLGQTHVVSVTHNSPASVIPLQRERHLLECLQQTPLAKKMQIALPVAEVSFTSGNHSYHAFVRTQVPGLCLTRLSRLQRQDDEVTPAQAERMGELMGLMHKHGPVYAVVTQAPVHSGGGNFRERLIERTERVGRALEWGKDERGLLLRMAAAQPAMATRAKVVFAHGDVHPGNLIASEQGRINGVIDWEKACATTPLEDMALMQPLPSTASLQLFLSGYRKATGDAPRVQDVLLAQTMRITDAVQERADSFRRPEAAPLKRDLSQRIVTLAEQWMRESSIPVREHKRGPTPT